MVHTFITPPFGRTGQSTTRDKHLWSRLVCSVSLVGLLGLGLPGGGVSALLAWPQRGPSAVPTPADLFMQSVVRRDGALGWHQLCPEVQAQLPEGVLIRQATAQQAADRRQGVTLSLEALGTQPQASGGPVHRYLLTAYGRQGWQAQRLYLVRTRASGCVEDVQNRDLPKPGATS
jgi:hypothetical protein